MKLETAYDNVPYHRKEAAKMPYNFYNLSTDQQCFFRDFFEEVVHNVKQKQILIEDLEIIKDDLEAVIARVKN